MNNRLVLPVLCLATICSGNAYAHEAGDLILRGGLANVAPDASSTELVLDGGAIGNSSADVDDNTQLGLTALYMLTDRWGVEVLASTPFSHDIKANTGDLGLGTIAAGDTKHLPPTVSIQYFFNTSQSAWRPYVGAGINYTLFFEEDVAAPLEGVLGSGSLSLDNSFGLAFQAGFDYQINDNLMLNASLRWIDIDTDAEFVFAANRITTEVDIDPWVPSVSIGWKF